MLPWDELLSRLGVALALGVLIGAERQWRHHAAGLQTNALVSLGAASFVIGAAADVGDPSAVARVAAQVVSGIGFLGAGVIMRQGVSIHGLNTAATLWCAAAIGTFSGAGRLAPAAVVALFVLLTNLFLHPLVRIINRQPLPRTSDAEVGIEYAISVTCRKRDEMSVRAHLLQGGEGLAPRRLESHPLDGPGDRVEVTAALVSTNRDDALVERLLSRLSLEAGVSAARWHVVPHQD